MKSFPLAKKNLGQHFLNDELVIDEITKNFKEKAKAIIEIGPGPAVLTKNLSKIPKDFFVVEKDQSLKPLLLPYLDEKDIIFTDALNFDLEEEFTRREYPLTDVWLISNLPYNISVPLFLKFLKIPSIEFMTLMFQQEVAEKILPRPKKGKEIKHSSLSIISQIYFETKLLIKVPPKSFTPPPKVESKVLSFIRKENPIIPLKDFNALEKFLRNLFNFKRKQLQKVLKTFYGHLGVDTILQDLGFVATIRAEDLTFDEIIQLFNYLQSKNSR